MKQSVRVNTDAGSFDNDLYVKIWISIVTIGKRYRKI